MRLVHHVRGRRRSVGAPGLARPSFDLRKGCELYSIDSNGPGDRMGADRSHHCLALRSAAAALRTCAIVHFVEGKKRLRTRLNWTFEWCAVSYVIGRSWRFSLQQGLYRPSSFSLDGGSFGQPDLPRPMCARHWREPPGACYCARESPAVLSRRRGGKRPMRGAGRT